uniref:Uncharacterized protein n=1 Tax=Globodera rostochiensis TaxID=31243 RepID=A0A914HSX8_GLORO
MSETRKRCADDDDDVLFVGEYKRCKIVKRRLPAELMYEFINFIPLMYLFGGINRKPARRAPSSCIAPINWAFDSFRSKRQKHYNNLEEPTPSGKRAGQWQIQEQISGEKFVDELRVYICYGRSANYNDLVIGSRAFNSVIMGQLCGQLLDFVTKSANPSSARKRTCFGVFYKEDEPSILRTSITNMVSSGIWPLMAKINRNRRTVQQPKKFSISNKKGPAKWAKMHQQQQKQHLALLHGLSMEKGAMEKMLNERIQHLEREVALLKIGHQQQQTLETRVSVSLMECDGSTSSAMQLDEPIMDSSAGLPGCSTRGAPTSFACAFAMDLKRRKMGK